MPPVVDVPGLTYEADYLRPDEQAALLECIDREPWRDDLRRRVQHYGYRYDYRRRTVGRESYLGPLPGWAEDCAERLRRDGYADQRLDQLIVNEYLPGQGIAPHVDCVPCFGDAVLSLSLGSACVLTMSRPEAGADRRVPVLLEPGGLLVMRGEARYEWRHGIAARKTDRYDERTVVRARRVSLTFRSVLAAD
ncbi:alpha-ketoglutarate-dependent dioxygenase AlkB [Micromonospora sp. NPDC049559]|uniref:alpha-ketoglutarate-dependent dioxygenase AlkB n=1 Tax=Micromonospora sp. NPDC049559 TaxID=3155923 RepID=UPI0034332989